VSTQPKIAAQPPLDLTLNVNGTTYPCTLDARHTSRRVARASAPDGHKKGCNFGECGACTVHLDGRRVNSCMVLAAQADGREVTTIEGLAHDDVLHPMQQAFIDCDGFQCGFCTPGQITSAVACVQEGHTSSDDEIREWMSGNICRCASYPQIVDAVKTVANTMKAKR
jgi:xanthine dehydrogenase YagT iron-sulfur-binding subunit